MMTTHQLTNELETDRLAAQALLKSGQSTTDQYMRQMMDEEHDIQRQFAEIHGGCSMGCTQSELVEKHSGLVCNWTRQPCPRQQLGSILDLYGAINK